MTASVAAVGGQRLDEDGAWALLQALSLRASRGAPACSGEVSLDELGALRADGYGAAAIALCPERDAGWQPLGAVDGAAAELLDLYVPLCAGEGRDRYVAAHLGQSLDGRVATVTGASRFVTGPDDVRHTHRLRALFDAVVVGVQTANSDDPRLTTRLVPGRQPVRVVIDPRARLRAQLRLLCDGAAPTLVLTAAGAWPPPRELAPHVQVLEIASRGDTLDLQHALDMLYARGFARVFIEGGGITVSRFLEAQLLDRLQLAIAPKIIGSGTLALRLPPIDEISEAIEARCRRFVLGADTLFDCDLRV